MTTGADRKLIFLHIPKTAGSTLRKIIYEQYHADETLKCYYHKQGISLREALDDMKAVSKEQAARVKIIFGHIGFGVHEHLPWSCSYFTILRDPVDRVISGYYHILRDDSHRYQAEVQRMSLKEYVSSDLLKSEAAQVNAVNALDNGQTRLLSGSLVETELSGGAVGYGPSSEEMLERAKKNIKENFVAVGLLERFDETLMLLKKLLGWSSTYYVRANVGWNRRSR
ncbi:MAG TPA: sulfotransferase family 2 domain-containing protein, partial [Blastocatellia bacterium]|nr:sulfotransferase family 2 domain-containing protein [Blastocatellia bacterium]